ncbi:MAG: LPS export ABC transporter ATP-binding protein [Simkaniaceae bacterium]
MILKVQNLEKSYGSKSILKGLNFEVKAGEVVGLLGPNGAGKTTAFYMTIGLIRPDKGQVFFKDQDVTKLPIHKRAKMGMGYLAQEPSIFRSLTVEENILCILETLSIPKSLRKRRLQELLHELHLEDKAKSLAVTLSGGERRRLEITRSLVTNPELLLLDEPFANVDPLTVQDLKRMIRHLTKKKISILITDHNARELFSIVDRSYLIQNKKVLTSGTKEEILKNPEAITHYFGDEFKL